MYSTLFCWFSLRWKPLLGNSTVVVVNMRLKGGAFDIHVVVICLNGINVFIALQIIVFMHAFILTRNVTCLLNILM